jgi:hypothetical protein
LKAQNLEQSMPTTPLSYPVQLFIAVKRALHKGEDPKDVVVPNSTFEEQGPITQPMLYGLAEGSKYVD